MVRSISGHAYIINDNEDGSTIPCELCDNPIGKDKKRFCSYLCGNKYDLKQASEKTKEQRKIKEA